MGCRLENGCYKKNGLRSTPTYWTPTSARFSNSLRGLSERTKNPALRQEFEKMRTCPVRDGQGRCSRFVDYVVGALIRHGVHMQFDLDDAFQRVMFWMLSPVGERGLPKKSLFDFDESRPYDLAVGNPLQAIFRQYLTNAVRTVAAGRIPSLRRVQHPNRVSITYARPGSEPVRDTVSAEEIPGRAETYDWEMLNDIMSLLRQRSTPEMPLPNLFLSVLKGEGSRVQRSRFGHSTATRADESSSRPFSNTRAEPQLDAVAIA